MTCGRDCVITAYRLYISLYVCVIGANRDNQSPVIELGYPLQFKERTIPPVSISHLYINF